MENEPEMLAMETIVPVYFAKEDDELLSIYDQTRAASASQGSASAAEGRPDQESGLSSRSCFRYPHVDMNVAILAVFLCVYV